MNAYNTIKKFNTVTRKYYCYIDLKDRTITAYLTKDQLLDDYVDWLGLEISEIFGNETIDFKDGNGTIKLRLRGHK